METLDGILWNLKTGDLGWKLIDLEKVVLTPSQQIPFLGVILDLNWRKSEVVRGHDFHTWGMPLKGPHLAQGTSSRNKSYGPFQCICCVGTGRWGSPGLIIYKWLTFFISLLLCKGRGTWKDGGLVVLNVFKPASPTSWWPRDDDQIYICWRRSIAFLLKFMLASLSLTHDYVLLYLHTCVYVAYLHLFNWYLCCLYDMCAWSALFVQVELGPTLSIHWPIVSFS